jgi:hypothetical protein
MMRMVLPVNLPLPWGWCPSAAAVLLLVLLVLVLGKEEGLSCTEAVVSLLARAAGVVGTTTPSSGDSSEASVVSCALNDPILMIRPDAWIDSVPARAAEVGIAVATWNSDRAFILGRAILACHNVNMA